MGGKTLKPKRQNRDDINVYIEDREYIANTYVMRCQRVCMMIHFIVFLLNVLGIFIVDKSIMAAGFIPVVFLYLITYVVAKKMSFSNSKTKYFILFSVVLSYTIIGVNVTYHAVLMSIVPILYATLYTSKKIMGYVYGLTVISTVVIVYGGYYYGLCDANMALLTATKLENYLYNGQFVLTEVNSNPTVTLFLFFVLPRCLLYITFATTCNSIYNIIRGSLEKAKHTAQMEEFQAELEKKVEEQTVELRQKQKKIEDLYIQTVAALSEAVDAKDRYTSGHSKRVAEYSRMIAKRMGKTEKEQEEIYRAGLLHDVGKIGVPVDIINKPGKLSEEEYNIIKLHPVNGYYILQGISGNSNIAIAAKCHHERYDGKGYPYGLGGENIPEIARILGVADSYDAMTSNRSYRDALPQQVVRAEIEKGKGTQFDPYIAQIMLQMMDEDKEYKMRQLETANRRILVVDEEADYENIKEIMKEEPVYEFTKAVNQEETCKLLEQERYDLIMFHTSVSKEDSLDYLRVIREKCQTPVVLMTEDKSIGTSEEYEKLGCRDYVTKPFLPVLVKEVIYNMTKK